MKGFVTFILLSILFVPQFSALGYVHEKSTYYHDTLFGKTFEFEPSLEEIVVVFNRGADFDAFEGTYNLDRAQVLDRQKLVGVYRIPDGLAAGDVIDLLEADPMVNRAAPAYIDQEDFIKYCVPTELTVRFNDGVAESRMTAIIEEVGSSVVRRQWTPGYFTISAPETRGYFETVRKLYKYKEVKFSEPSIISYNDFCFTPDDQYFDQQWALKNTGQIPTCSGCTPYGDHDIDAEPGWDIGRGDPGVVISIIDTGMDLDHPDLAGNLLPRNGHDWDFADPNDDSPDDTYGHGTKCSGIAAAVTNNAIGVAGIGHLCQIMPLRVSLTSGQNQNRADAINYATSRRPDFDGLVLSNSWRMSSGDYTAVHDAIVNAYANDVLVCFSAGNTNGSVNYPAIYPEAMAIAASSPCDERKNPSSCDGEGWGSSYGPELDCAAPGVKIYTTSLYGNYTPTFNGTSAACPHVAGLAGVIWSLDPTLSNVEVREIINESADQVGGYYYDPGTGKSLELGHGRINLAAAAEMAMPPAEITWTEHKIPGHLTGSHDVFAIDLDRDGDQDVLAVAFNEDAVIWWENRGPAQIFPWREHYISGNVDGAFTVHAADLDRDGDIDIVAGGKYVNGFYLWKNDGFQNFQEIRVNGGYGVLDISTVDLNSDGHMDVLGAVAGDNRISWWVNDGQMDFREVVIVSDFNYAISIYALDMDFDRDIDVLGAAMDDDKISWFENDGSQNFREHVLTSRFNGASDVFAIDIDRDNDIDILAGAAFEPETILLWEYVGISYEPVWIEHQITGHFTGTMDVYAADLSGDGLPDVMAAAPNEDAIIWWENLGGYSFDEKQITSAYKGAWEVYAVDLDGDTDIDVIGAGTGVVGNVSWWESDLVSGSPKRESDDQMVDLPRHLLVSSPYPNPFNASITIQYDLPKDSYVTIDIFDILGRRVTTLVNAAQPAGSHHMIWDAPDRSSGIYFYRIQAGEFTETKKMTLLK